MISLEDLCLFYDSEKVFSKGNLTGGAGEILVVTGCSGSGKSSLLKCINGIIPQVDKGNVTGRIRVNGQDFLDKSIEERSSILSTVFQNPKTQFFCVESMDEIAFGLENRNVSREEILRIIDEKTAELKTEHLKGRNLFTLSGGEKQLVAITATACLNNKVYLFDEPTSSLDEKTIQWLRKVFIKLKAEGKTVIVAEHRLYFLMDILDRLCVIEDGRFHIIEKKEIEEKGELLRERYGLRSFDHETGYESLIKVDLMAGTVDEPVPEVGLYCRDFKCRFEKRMIMDFSIHFEPGINFITGENGMGKSTFIRKITGSLKGKGQVFYNGKRVRKTYEYMAAVMQEVNYQLFTDSVLQEVMISRDNQDKAEEILEKFDLKEKMDLHPQVLSGGEKQRLLIARAFLSDCPVVIFDEPTSGLCRGQMENICSCLKELEDMGRTVIVATHDSELINLCGGKVYRFYRN